MATKNNGTVKVEGIDPNATQVPTTINADIYGGGNEAIGGYNNGLGNALFTYDRDTQTAVSTNGVKLDDINSNTLIPANADNYIGVLFRSVTSSIGMAAYSADLGTTLAAISSSNYHLLFMFVTYNSVTDTYVLTTIYRPQV
jgi:hypothetical protein